MRSRMSLEHGEAGKECRYQSCQFVTCPVTCQETRLSEDYDSVNETNDKWMEDEDEDVR